MEKERRILFPYFSVPIVNNYIVRLKEGAKILGFVEKIVFVRKNIERFLIKKVIRNEI